MPLQEASSRTPLHDTYGIITPSSLHFERHHGGVPEIDPATHTLTIHGMVDRPLVFTVDDLKRMPSVSRIHFLECSGNSGGEWRGGSGETETDVQRIHGLTSCSEWTGVPVSTLLRECGADAERHLGARRRRRRVQARSQHPDEEDARRCDGGVRAERRAAAPRAGLSDAAAAARLGRATPT